MTGKSFSPINTEKIPVSHYLALPCYKQLSEHPLMDDFFNGLFLICICQNPNYLLLGMF